MSLRDRGRPLLFAGICLATLSSAVVHADTRDLVMAPEPLRYCAVCHGVELIGNRAVDAPKLAGLPAWYLSRQMQAFRNGWRGVHEADVTGMEMRPQATVLDAVAVADAVRYAASVPASPAPPTAAGDAERGATLYQPCAACHGVNGEGNEALLSPPLAGQSDWYLETQLDHFRSGARGSMPGDIQGALMRASTMTLTDAAAIKDVVAYINTLQQPSAKERENTKR